MNIYVRVNFRDEYHNTNMTKAVNGFREMGAYIIKYHDISEIMNKLTKEDIVIDYIHQIQSVFNHFNCNYQLIDYPSCFIPFYGREIKEDFISNIAENEQRWPIFMKSKKTKLFAGKVIKNIKDLRGINAYSEDLEVFYSEVIDIRSEYRIFILYDEIKMISLYKGDYHYKYDPIVVDQIIEAFKTWKDRPNGCGIDIGVTSDYKTIVVEVNDGYALGSYGTQDIMYAKIMSALLVKL